MGLRAMWRMFLLLPIVLSSGCAAGPAPPPFLGPGPDAGWVLFFVVAVGIVAWLARTPLSRYWHSRNGANDLTPYEILRERYAKGEISRDEYLRIASDLDTHGQPRGA
jgi:Short C-terminal domain